MADSTPISADTKQQTDHSSAASHGHPGFWTLVLGSIGVVYGDIGTSPLYALRESLALVGENGVSQQEVLGVVSLLIWALTLVVTVKYIIFITRADNKGEGGTLSLMTLARSVATGKYSTLLLIFGMVGASLLYGDAMLTPAISVLSAVEGMKLVTPVFEPYVVPLTLVIIAFLFSMQSKGTAKMATYFGPITLVWFLAMAACAVPYLVEHPQVFLAFIPFYGLNFLIEHSAIGLVVLGAVFLAVTGAEALYADMGHFGKKPIRTAWLIIAFPALILNYLGQGALIINQPEALENPFFLLAPSWALVPMVILATLATTIASQAMITGAFSLTRQAVQLGLLPRLEIRHTSETLAGQIYLPQINALLFVGVVILVLEFGSSSGLASAYGIAVSGTMLVTTLLAFTVVWKVWQKPLWMSLLILVPFLFIDSTFFLANLMKFFAGGYIPLLLGAGIFTLMWTWMRGSAYLLQKVHKDNISMKDLLMILEKTHPACVPGTAVFLTSDEGLAPTALLHNLKHNKVMHASNIIMTIHTASTPRVPECNRIKTEQLADNILQAVVTFGYMETPNVPLALTELRKHGLKFDIMSTSFFLGRRSIKASAKSGMPLWQDRIYIALARNATNATEFFHIPAGRVVELGTQLTI